MISGSRKIYWSELYPHPDLRKREVFREDEGMCWFRKQFIHRTQIPPPVPQNIGSNVY